MSGKLNLKTSLSMIAILAMSSTALAGGKPTVAKILPLNHTCSNTLFFIAQDMTSQQFVDSCAKVGAEEGYFHSLLETNALPVANDLNNDLRMVIFDDYNQYKRYGSRLFNINTDNGGMYIEGNATDSNNQASFYAHEADWLRPEFVIWNLKHEYVHYLDGRFNLKGNFADYPTNTVWWSEGLAEYVSKENTNDDAISLINANGGNRTLAAVFATTYNNTVEEIYDWGYIGNRFMFENHMEDVRAIRSAGRSGNWSEYQNIVNNLGSSYEAQWQSWLIDLAGGGNGGGTGGGTGGSNEVLLDTNVSGDATSWSHYQVDTSGAGTLSVIISGGSGDADLYVKDGSQTSANNWDCRPYVGGNEETCEISVASAATVHIGINGYQAFSNVGLTATFTAN